MNGRRKTAAPKAAQPVHWLRFLSDLLYPEDIPTVQEFIGYCLIPVSYTHLDVYKRQACCSFIWISQTVE